MPEENVEAFAQSAGKRKKVGARMVYYSRRGYVHAASAFPPVCLYLIQYDGASK
jgi:hypothetical protein